MHRDFRHDRFAVRLFDAQRQCSSCLIIYAGQVVFRRLLDIGRVRGAYLKVASCQLVENLIPNISFFVLLLLAYAPSLILLVASSQSARSEFLHQHARHVSVSFLTIFVVSVCRPAYEEVIQFHIPIQQIVVVDHAQHADTATAASRRYLGTCCPRWGSIVVVRLSHETYSPNSRRLVVSTHCPRAAFSPWSSASTSSFPGYHAASFSTLWLCITR